MCPRRVTAVNGMACCISRWKADAWAERGALSRVLKGNVQTFSQLQGERSHALHEMLSVSLLLHIHAVFF